MLIVGALFIDYKYERFTMSIDQNKLFHSKQHQRARKLATETQLERVAIMLQGHMGHSDKMNRRTRLLESRLHEQINGFKKSMDEYLATKGHKDVEGHPDEVDKEFVRMFQTYLDDIETLVHENSLGLKKDAHASKSLVKEIKKVVLGELEAEVEEDRRGREEREHDRKMGLDDGHDRTAAQEDEDAMAELSDEDRKKWEEAKESLVTVLEHLEQKLGGMGGVEVEAAAVEEVEAAAEREVEAAASTCTLDLNSKYKI
jgi:sugar diacid utilization regulator